MSRTKAVTSPAAGHRRRAPHPRPTGANGSASASPRVATSGGAVRWLTPVAAAAPRPRLHERIDEVLDRYRIAWLSAPAGSGKTETVRSWIEARRRPCLWHGLHSSDGDPATFFHGLREAVGAATQRRKTPPRPTPAQASRWAASRRDVLGGLGAWVRPGTILVLDDYQALPEDAPLQSLLPAALAALPEEARALVLSRSGPPPPFARLITAGAIGFLEAGEFNLTSEEAQALARARAGGRVGAAEVEALRRRTGGWIAGTALLLEGPARVLPAARGVCDAAQQVLFDYFAAEVFDRASVETQRLLLATALLPEVTPTSAEALAEEPRAAELLADLVHHNCFTLRLGGQEPRYRYHPLFREFLAARARTSFAPGERRALSERTAALLRRLVRESRLSAPAAADAWPWLLEVRALGGFELRRDGEAISLGPKVRKPLELLQALVVLGGAEIRERTLADSLWPEADGDAAQHALETTLYRLRKLLGSPGLVVQSGRAIGLDLLSCWSDVRALRQRLGPVPAPAEREEAREDAAAVVRETERVLELYRGPLLPSLDADWANEARQRLREKVAHFVGAAARQLADGGERPAAMALERRALEADPELGAWLSAAD